MPIEAETVIVKVVLEVYDQASEALRKVAKTGEKVGGSMGRSIGPMLTMLFTGMALSRAFRGFNQQLDTTIFNVRQMAINSALMNAYLGSAVGQMEYAMRTGFDTWLLTTNSGAQGAIATFMRLVPLIGQATTFFAQLSLIKTSGLMNGLAVMGLTGGNLLLLLGLLSSAIVLFFWNITKQGDAGVDTTENLREKLDNLFGLIHNWAPAVSTSILAFIDALGAVPVGDITLKFSEIFQNVERSVDEKGNYIITLWDDTWGDIVFTVDGKGKLMLTSVSGRMAEVLKIFADANPLITTEYGAIWDNIKISTDEKGNIIIEKVDDVQAKFLEMLGTARVVQPLYDKEMEAIANSTETKSKRAVDAIQTVIDKYNELVSGLPPGATASEVGKIMHSYTFSTAGDITGLMETLRGPVNYSTQNITNYVTPPATNPQSAFTIEDFFALMNNYQRSQLNVGWS